MSQENHKSVFRSVFGNLLTWVKGGSDANSDEQCVRYSGLFDANWYLTKYPDIAETKMDPLEHYLKHGGFAGRWPGPKFDSHWYLKEYPDVLLEEVNPLLHYIRHGKKEGRKPLSSPSPRKEVSPPLLINQISMNIDALLYCHSGTMLIIGWIDDCKSPLCGLSVFPGQNQEWNTTVFSRVRRPDVESALQSKSGYLFGFWSVIRFESDLSVDDPCKICGNLADGRSGQIEVKPQIVSDSELRDTTLAHLAKIEYYYGNRDTENFLALDTGIGSELIELNRKITASVIPGVWVSYYGPTHKNYLGSIIVCLFGKHEFMFLQSALFSLAAGAEDYEFVFVSNSPELTLSLEKEARICARIYGVSIVLVCLPDNVGFGSANNVAARFARSKRLLFINPDVFPRDNDWARRHTDIIRTAPKDQTLMFGAPLYYDDGSLMHHGIYFNIDAGISVSTKKISSHPMVRTEHYGKGAPAWSKQFICPRPVPAITGAFISIDRDWFETLGGFNEDYLFGHYEDVDLCLKSLVRGKPVWIHDFPMWHMEGKGSIKQREHEGGSLANRWLFTQLWGEMIARELLGPEPSCPALRVSPQVSSDRKANSIRGAA